MSCAIVKLSYNNSGDSSLSGGICGTGFYVNNNTAITANHVLNKNTFIPNQGFCHAMVWLISRKGNIHALKKNNITAFPEIDTTIIKTNTNITDTDIYILNDQRLAAGSPVFASGHTGNTMPQINAGWEGTSLCIYSVNLRSVASDTEGQIARLVTMTVNANDIKMQNVQGFELSFGSCIGMSGGPVLYKNTNLVVGMLSIGLPPDVSEKTATFAVAAYEIKKRL